MEFIAVGLALVVGFGLGFYVAALKLGRDLANRINVEIKSGNLSQDDASALIDRASAAFKRGRP